MPGSRKTRPSGPFICLLLLAAAAFAAGCSTANDATPHPVGATWVTTPPAAQPHGNDAKAAPGGSTGFASCQFCHGAGTNFAGGSSGISCYTCHGVSAPHSPAPWRASAGSTYTHTNTNPANAPACAQCHQANPGAPGCFNNTLCHGAAAGHPAGWVAVPPAPQPHGIDAKAANGYPGCQTCHGADFAGTTSSGNVSCFNNALCHGATATWPHAPAPWRASAGSTYTHTTTAETGNAAVCAVCHFPGSPNNPAGHPATPAPAGTTPGCFNSTLCHDGGGGAPHAVPYNDPTHYGVTAATFPAGCSACHDVSAPSAKVGPVCQTCHVAASPLTALTCTSCHAAPPNGGAPAGPAYPNVSGAHATHVALNGAGTPISCNTCHNGLGSGTLNHYNAAKSRTAPGDAAFPATYAAQSGASAFDNSAALSCSNVSCHGGQATPNWQTGTLDVNTQCTSCHTTNTTTQFNGPTSANHNRAQHQVTCTVCHNATTLAVNHFTNLSTPALEGPASATIGGAGTGIPAGNYNPATGSCLPSCHGTETW